MNNTKVDLKLVSMKFSELNKDLQGKLTKGLKDSWVSSDVTIWFDKETGVTALNEESSMYSTYKDLMPRLIELDKQELDEFEAVFVKNIKAAGRKVSELIKCLLDDEKLRRKWVADYEAKQETKKLLKTLRKQSFPNDYINTIGAIKQINTDTDTIALIDVFSYGVMIGKQQERARRKAKKCFQ